MQYLNERLHFLQTREQEGSVLVRNAVFAVLDQLLHHKTDLLRVTSMHRHHSNPLIRIRIQEEELLENRCLLLVDLKNGRDLALATRHSHRERTHHTAVVVHALRHRRLYNSCPSRCLTRVAQRRDLELQQPAQLVHHLLLHVHVHDAVLLEKGGEDLTVSTEREHYANVVHMEEERTIQQNGERLQQLATHQHGFPRVHHRQLRLVRSDRNSSSRRPLLPPYRVDARVLLCRALAAFPVHAHHAAELVATHACVGRSHDVRQEARAKVRPNEAGRAEGVENAVLVGIAAIQIRPTPQTDNGSRAFQAQRGESQRGSSHTVR